ncbi:hypothetical protein FQZ97_869930 [compost metagenome]
MYAPTSRLCAAASVRKIMLWLVTWMAWPPRSSSTMPMASGHSEVSSHDSGSQAATSSTSAASVVRCPKPWSAQRPARAAARAPTAPTSPKAPMAVCESP